MRNARRLIRAVFLVGAASALLQSSLAQDANEIVHFESLTFPGQRYTPFMPPPEVGNPVTIFGILRVPAGAARVPAVILAHGCGGISGAEQYWARRLISHDVATFVVNSFSGREISSICSGRPALNMASVLTDVYRAATLLAAHPRIDAARIAVMGFSCHPRFQQRYGAGSPRIAAHLALYPASCYIRLADEDRIGDAPIRIFQGTADDLTPIAPCRNYVGRLRAMGKDAALFEYSGARHGFDDAAATSRDPVGTMNTSRCTLVERDGTIVDAETGELAGPDSACVTRGGTIGHSPEARQRAAEDVQNFLGALFRLK
jgi:dienelactone hydrolase